MDTLYRMNISVMHFWSYARLKFEFWADDFFLPWADGLSPHKRNQAAGSPPIVFRNNFLKN